MKDPGKILTKEPGMGMKGLLFAMAIPAALITSTMFYSVEQLNTAGEREAILLDSLAELREIAPKTVTTFDTLLQLDTVTIAGHDTVLQKDTVIERVEITQQAVQSLTGVWPEKVELLASNPDREILIRMALRRFPGQEGLEKQLRAKGYFRLNPRSSTPTTPSGTADGPALRDRREMLSRSARVVARDQPVFIILNPLQAI
jgi:hypothetical protein